MPEDLNALIEKIQTEGVDAAKESAAKIEAEAKNQARRILEKAKLDAESVIAGAKQETARARQATEALLKQAARDTLLNLRKEINAAFDKIISARVKEALGHEEIPKIIASLIKDAPKEAKHGAVVKMNKRDLDKLENIFLSELKDEIKKGLTLKSSDDITAGFTISFDESKSQYDFTDKALAEYIGAYLKPMLAQILKG